MNDISFCSSRNDVQHFLDRVHIALQNDANLIFIRNRRTEKANLQYTNETCMNALEYEVNDVINEIRSLCVKHYYETLFDDKQRGTMPLFVFIKEIQKKQVYIKIKLKEIEEGEKVMLRIMKCEMCGKEHSVEILKEKAMTYVKNELVEYEETVYFCNNCDEDEAYYVPAKILNENLMNARNAYRKMKGLLSSYEIVEFRKKYNLSQTELSKIMDFGEVTISRYESKSIQEETHDNMLRIVIENPLELLKLLEKNKGQFEEYHYELIRSRIVNVIHSGDNAIIKRQNLSNYYTIYSQQSIENGYTPLNIDKLEQIINFIAINISSALNKVRLMKLLWYSDALSYKENGIAISGLVYTHNNMGALPLGHSAILELSGINVQEKYNWDFDFPTYTIFPKDNSSTSLLSEKELNVIRRVCDKFGNFTGKQIAEYMHQETAYTKTDDRDIITFSYAKEIREF